jgi:hypothetical protein
MYTAATTIPGSLWLKNNKKGLKKRSFFKGYGRAWKNGFPGSIEIMLFYRNVK